ncbi:MAG TPA: hypothetical protein VEA17_06205 [Bordetella sp.]|nr:hypothetical protein [Bordetella sp.]
MVADSTTMNAWSNAARARLASRAAVSGLDVSTPGGRRARLAFLATEGAFMLRFFGFMDIGQAEWDAIFDDMQTLL